MSSQFSNSPSFSNTPAVEKLLQRLPTNFTSVSYPFICNFLHSCRCRLVQLFHRFWLGSKLHLALLQFWTCLLLVACSSSIFFLPSVLIGSSQYLLVNTDFLVYATLYPIWWTFFVDLFYPSSCYSWRILIRVSIFFFRFQHIGWAQGLHFSLKSLL